MRSATAEADGALGQALCADCYDYEAAVLFNAGVSELWRRTTIYALRALGSLAGMSAREAARRLRLSYVKVVEFQTPGLGPPPRAGPGRRPRRRARRGTRGDRRRHAGCSPPHRGEQGERTPARCRCRSPDDLGTPDRYRRGRRRGRGPPAGCGLRREVRDEGLGRARRARPPPQVRRSRRDSEAARAPPRDWWRPRGRSPISRRSPTTTCGLWAHTCGFRGHFLTKSRRYSTTFGELRAERQRWRLAALARPVHRTREASPDEAVVREWRYEGSGYLTAGDACLARNLEDELRLGSIRGRARRGTSSSTQVGPGEASGKVGIHEGD